jgi:16S rRNA (cytosine967-C5)-methyltransferase
LSTQAGILDSTRDFLCPGGVLAYATCSILTEENAGQAHAFIARHPDFFQLTSRQFLPALGCDGFYLSVFQRKVADAAN